MCALTPNVTELETDRLHLRQWLPNDYAPFAVLNADPEVMACYPRPLTESRSHGLGIIPGCSRCVCRALHPGVRAGTLGVWVIPSGVIVHWGTLTTTSIGITVRVLMDVKRHQRREGQIIGGAAVLDDILGVVLLVLLYEFSIGEGINVLNASKVLVFLATFLMLAPIAAKLIAQLIKHFEQVTTISGLIPTSVVSLVLFFAWLAHEVGAPELLGGFAAGLARAPVLSPVRRRAP